MDTQARPDATTVLLADGKQEVRSALRLLLEEERGHSVAEARDAAQLLALLSPSTTLDEGAPSDVAAPSRGHTATDGSAVSGRAPVILLDWELPGMEVTELVARLRRLAPGAFIVGLSTRLASECAWEEAGADLFLSKGEPPERVLAVLDGRSACSADRGGG